MPSPRNSVAAHLELLGSLSCQTYLTPRVIPVVIGEVLSEGPIKHVTVPELEEWLDSEDARPFPFEKSFEEARFETFVISHTSGSTGVPKLIEITHGTFSAQDSFQTLAAQGARPTILENFKSVRMHLGLPLFHSAAYFCFFSAATYYNMTSVVAPAVPLTAEVANGVHTHGKVHACCLPPSILVDISKDRRLLEHIKGMKFAMYGGGPLPKDAGDLIQNITGTPILSLLGTTETMLLPLEYPDMEDWEYHRFSSCLGADFRHRWDDLYELIIVRNPELDLSQAAFATFPTLQEFSPGDLYSKHPSKEGLWRYGGRADDVVVFVNGEKLNPITMEGVIGSHPEVQSALCFGTGRFQSGVLVELKQRDSSEEVPSRLLDSIWPYIERANQSSPSHGRIMKGMVIFTSIQKPMMRAGKGTVQRGNTFRLYEKEINALYESNTAMLKGLPPVYIKLKDESTLRPVLRDFMFGEMGLKGIGEEDDFFMAGLDSLRVINTARYINAAAESQGLEKFHLPTKAIYANPSVAKLTSKIISLTKSG